MMMNSRQETTTNRRVPLPAIHRHLGPSSCSHSAPDSAITEFKLNWGSDKKKGSTHEIIMNEHFIFISGQNMDKIAKFDYEGHLLCHFTMPINSGPHGMLIDTDKKLWVSLEFHGLIVNIDQETGKIVDQYDINMAVSGCHKKINPAPHGITLDRDGHTIWFTGKRTSTIGRIVRPAGKIEHYELPSLGAVPIYLTCTPNRKVYGTELLGGKILQLSMNDHEEVTDIQELPSILPSSFHCLDHAVVPLERPIAVIPDPTNPRYVWFTEEAGGKIGRIDTTTGAMLRYNVPLLQKNHLLGSLAFDREGALWVQVYVDMNNPMPVGYDYLIRFHQRIHQADQCDCDTTTVNLTGVGFAIFTIPTKNTVLHRMRLGYDGNLWFTELMADQLGKVDMRKVKKIMEGELSH